MSVRHDIFLDAFSPDYRRYFGLFQPRERVTEPLRGEALAHYEWLADVLYAGALLARNSVFVPHAFVFQCPLLSRLVERNRLLVRESILRMPMGDGDVGESLEKMRMTFPRREFPRLFTRDAEAVLPTISEATIPLVAKLTEGIARIVERLPITRENGRSRWDGVPARDVKIVVRSIQKTFDQGAPITYRAALERTPVSSPLIRRLMFACIHYAYGAQHVREYGLAILRDIPGIHDHFGIDTCCPGYSYRRFWLLLRHLGLNRDFLRNAGPEGIVVLRARRGVTLILDRFARALRSRRVDDDRSRLLKLPVEVARQLESLAQRQTDLLGRVHLRRYVHQPQALGLLDELAAVWTLAYQGERDLFKSGSVISTAANTAKQATGARGERSSVQTLIPRVALLTVIGPELTAIKRALDIDESARLPGNGELRYEVLRKTVFNGVVRIEVTCMGKPGNAASAAAGTRIIQRGAKFLLLCGTAAGVRRKVRIGDIVTPRSIVDTTLKVAEGGLLLPRPLITSPLLGVLQMNAAAAIDPVQWQQLFSTIADGPNSSGGNEEGYQEDVASAPQLHESAILTDNLLLRDPSTLVDAANELHQQIRAGEMEAGGFVMACNDPYPPVPWFVIRGVSDFGDQLKRDRFHRLAASAAASYAALYLRDVLDLRIWGESSGVT